MFRLDILRERFQVLFPFSNQATLAAICFFGRDGRYYIERSVLLMEVKKYPLATA